MFIISKGLFDLRYSFEISELVDFSCDYLLEMVVSLVDLVGFYCTLYLELFICFSLWSILSLIVLTMLYLIYFLEDGVIFLYFLEPYAFEFRYEMSKVSSY